MPISQTLWSDADIFTAPLAGPTELNPLLLSQTPTGRKTCTSVRPVFAHLKNVDFALNGTSSPSNLKVVRVEDQEAGVEIAPNVTVKVVKSMISEVRSRGEPAAANDGKA